ncbi:hypothetical protein CSUB01_05109 [Colletotrichum sublineola]|uniref:BTB domain-containing protein n=1 Tax=Colletotrichum sublineola TaxID=1173701 RepID=A0A066XEB9_COLSU|nr:hypothetical protein CSUB01_05109 [Colletotrichum sublineola]
MSPDRKVEMDDIIKSRNIKFVIGEDQVECNVHEAVIVNLSEPLRALVTNGMRESVEARVVREDVEIDTFTKLSQFAYENDYTIIDPDEGLDQDDYYTINQRICKVATGEYTLKTEFASEFVGKSLEEARHGTFGDWHKQFLQPRSHSHEHYMSHVRLYILADRYAVFGLMSLSIQKIRDMLVNNPLDGELFATVWKLLAFIWPRTKPKDELRTLLLGLLLLDLEEATKSPEAANVFANTPEIAAALILMPSAEYWNGISLDSFVINP